jgi:hydroxyacylglutathione hydrolase
MAARVDHTVTYGMFSSGGITFALDNNAWALGDDSECVVFDAPHDLDAISALIGDRRLVGVLCTHAHNDHVTVAVPLARKYGTSVWLHPDDEFLWRQSWPDDDFEPIADGQVFTVAGVDLEVRHTPGHTPGAVCYVAASLGEVFSGDTLFHGGPGATRWDYSSFPQIVTSIREKLFVLPREMVVHTGHGENTTIGAESDASPAWVDLT